MKRPPAILSICCLALCAAAAPAPVAAECPEGTFAWPSIGVDTFQCPGGSCTTFHGSVVGRDGSAGTPGETVRPLGYDFSTEPRLRAIDPAGPAADRLHEGDVLVAVNGYLITTVRGGQELAALPLDRPAELTVRRNDRLLTVEVRPVSRCGPPLTLSGDRVLIAKEWDEGGPYRGAFGGLGVWLECDGCRFDFGAPVVWSGKPRSRRIVRVREDGPAFRAGLRKGDVIVAIDDFDLDTRQGNEVLFERLYRGGPDPAEMKLTVRRGSRTVEVTVDVAPRDTRLRGLTIRRESDEWGIGLLRSLSLWWSRGERRGAGSLTMSGTSWGPGELGLVLSWCDGCYWRLSGRTLEWNLDEYPTIVSVDRGGPADRAGLQPGDRLTALDGHDLRTREAGVLLMSLGDQRKGFDVLYERDGQVHETSLRPR